MEDSVRIIEINGCRFEVDTRAARRIDTFKVGDPVKLLKKKYGDSFEVHPGFICGVDAFNGLPTITVCYTSIAFGSDGKLEFEYINSKSKDVEIILMTEADAIAGKDTALAVFNQAIHKKRIELADLEMKRDYFTRKFGVAFSTTPSDMPTANDQHSSPLGGH